MTKTTTMSKTMTKTVTKTKTTTKTMTITMTKTMTMTMTKTKTKTRTKTFDNNDSLLMSNILMSKQFHTLVMFWQTFCKACHCDFQQRVGSKFS